MTMRTKLLALAGIILALAGIMLPLLALADDPASECCKGWAPPFPFAYDLGTVLKNPVAPAAAEQTCPPGQPMRAISFSHKDGENFTYQELFGIQCVKNTSVTVTTSCSWLQQPISKAADVPAVAPPDSVIAGIRFEHNKDENLTYQERFNIYTCKLNNLTRKGAQVGHSFTTKFHLQSHVRCNNIANSLMTSIRFFHEKDKNGTHEEHVDIVCEDVLGIPATGATPTTGATPPAGPDPCAGLTGDLLDMCRRINADRAEHGVPALTWSADLVKNAQAWVGTKPDDPNGCHKDKDQDGNIFFCHQHKPTPDAPFGCGTDPNYRYGENLAWATPDLTGVQAVDGWYCEGDPANYDYNNPKLIGGTMNGCNDNPKKVNGHFTQLVWKATKSVGCAKNTCSLGGQSGTLWACEFDPQGNFNAGNPGVLSDNVPRPIQGFAHFRAAAAKPPAQKSTKVISDVDLYDQPGGKGKKTGILRKGQTLAFMGCHADNWCQVAGGWVWGSFIVRNHSR
jgi:hypothetical protein